jgi:hypothetical protein
METKIASSLRLIVCAVACLAILPLIASTRSAHAFFRNYNEAWCAQMGDGIEDCSYYTWQQCRAAASGTGNFCFANPRYVPQQQRKSKRKYYRG